MRWPIIVPGQQPNLHRQVRGWVWLLLLSWTNEYVVAQPVRLTAITVLDEFGKSKTLPPTSSLDLQARENYLTFRFQASRPVPLRYQLAGLDNGWQTGLSTDRIHYANLPGGTYVLRWRASSAAGEGRVTIRIEAPFWRRWWFVPTVLLYLLGVVGLVSYLFLQYRFRQRLRAIHARDRISRDLHDDMGSYLSSISILSRSAANAALTDPERTRQQLEKIGQTARQVMESMNDIVWSINPEHDSMPHVIHRMTDVGTALFTDTDTDFTLQIGDEVGAFSLDAQARHDFFLIYKEALTNAARYAQANRVRASLQRTQDGITLTIQDNGRGFDTQQPDYQNPGGGNGVKNMHTRANLLGGTLAVSSAIGEGTTVQLILNHS